MTGYNNSVSYEFSPPFQGEARDGHSPLEGSPTLVGRGVHPPRANAERISSFPLRRGSFNLNCMEAQ